MNKEIKHTIYSSTDCLSEKILFEYIDNKLIQKERHFVEKHLLDCELCCDALEGLELVKDRRRIDIIKAAINRRILTSSLNEAKLVPFNFKLAFSIAASIALLIGGVFLFNMFSLKESAQSDMAELKSKETTSLTPLDPIDNAKDSPYEQKPDDVSGDSKKLQNKLSRSKIKADDIALSETKKNPGGYNKTPINNKGLTFEKSVNDQETEIGLKEEENKIESAEQIHYTSSPSVYQTIEIKSIVTAEESSIYRNAAADLENDSNINPTIKTESNGTGNSGKLPSQNQKNKDNSVRNSGDIAKKSDKNSREQSENKAKDKIVLTDDSRADEDGDVFTGGSVGYEPRNAAGELDKKKSEVFSTTVSTKSVTDSIEQIYTIVEQMPEYPGGKDSMMKFISKNFIYSKVNQENPSNSTKIYVQFVVGKDGVIRNQKILKGINTSLDKVALRVVEMMPKWKPGKQNGEPVSVSYVLPIQLEIK